MIVGMPLALGKNGGPDDPHQRMNPDRDWATRFVQVLRRDP